MSTTGNGEPAQQPICGDQSIARGLLDRQRKAWGAPPSAAHASCG